MPPRTRSIIAHHLILTLYGHWPPNDSRGCGSAELRDPKFSELGDIHHGRKPDDEQPSREELRNYHRQAGDLLVHPVIWIDNEKRKTMATAFEDVIASNNYTCYACAILKNHAHLVIRIRRDSAQQMMNYFMEETARYLRQAYPDQISPNHPVWTARPYKVFLFNPQDVWTRIRYVEKNPEKENLPPQSSPFTTPYDNWPHHQK